jgi:hypothetical protein
MSEPRAKLLTSTFTLECPHCKERQINGRGSHAFRAGEVRPNEKRTCTNRECGKTFQLPARLVAAVTR